MITKYSDFFKQNAEAVFMWHTERKTMLNPEPLSQKVSHDVVFQLLHNVFGNTCYMDDEHYVMAACFLAAILEDQNK